MFFCWGNPHIDATHGGIAAVEQQKFQLVTSFSFPAEPLEWERESKKHPKFQKCHRETMISHHILRYVFYSKRFKDKIRASLMQKKMTGAASHQCQLTWLWIMTIPSMSLARFFGMVTEGYHGFFP
jgi:hypothetical protein